MYTKRMQYQAIVDRLAGLPVSFTAGDFDGRLKACWEALDTAVPGQEVQAIYNVPATILERMEFIEMLRSPSSPANKSVACPPWPSWPKTCRPSSWVWQRLDPPRHDHPPRCRPRLRQVPRRPRPRQPHHQGRAFPDGQPVPHPGRPIIYVDAEVATQIHHQRALDWQMDMDQIFMKLPGSSEVIDLANPLDRDRLVEEVARQQARARHH